MVVRSIIQVILSLIATYLAAKYLPGVTTDDLSAILVVCGAVALLNLVLRPMVAWLSYAFTIFTVGLILLMINAAFIKLASLFIDGFSIESWGTAFLFSLIVTSILILSDRLLLRKSY